MTKKEKQKEMRDIVAVIDRIIELIQPGIVSDVYPGDLTECLKQIKRRVPYKAPEAQIELWYEFASALDTFLPQPNESAPAWVLEIREVFAGRKQ